MIICRCAFQPRILAIALQEARFGHTQSSDVHQSGENLVVSHLMCKHFALPGVCSKICRHLPFLEPLVFGIEAKLQSIAKGKLLSRLESSIEAGLA